MVKPSRVAQIIMSMKECIPELSHSNASFVTKDSHQVETEKSTTGGICNKDSINVHLKVVENLIIDTLNFFFIQRTATKYIFHLRDKIQMVVLIRNHIFSTLILLVQKLKSLSHYFRYKNADKSMN